jgi:hypothetical protein
MIKRRAILSIIAIVAFSGLLMAQTHMPAAAFENKSTTSSTPAAALTGIVSDSMCGAQHMAKDKSATECTRECVKGGSKYALVVDKKVYTLEGHEAELDKVAGMKATVKGKVSGETVNVQSVISGMKM